MRHRNKQEYFTGCLLGGAVGDALGWPIEFENFATIKNKYGPDGILDMVPGEGGLFEITDDTQMTLFTAEGLLRSWTAARQSGCVPNFTAALSCSYLSWLKTQGESSNSPNSEFCSDGWLFGIEGLHRQRAPGDTCLSALREGAFSENGFADNTSKGCGGVMRAAPAGLLAARINNGDRISTAQMAFEIGCAAAALTHGHPSGYYPAGALAAVIATIITGGTIEESIIISLGLLDGCIGSKETVDAVQNAVNLWRNDDLTPSPDIIESLGGGWVGEEALAIALYCALVAGNDFVRGLQLAVNHSGDSDSTGSITGNILGVMLGEQAIPGDWLKRLELVDVIRQVGNDLYTSFESTECWLRSYPPVMYPAIQTT
jgi:ADP-ribosyl-[dinitrogen reductase] hydrolase